MSWPWSGGRSRRLHGGAGPGRGCRAAQAELRGSELEAARWPKGAGGWRSHSCQQDTHSVPVSPGLAPFPSCRSLPQLLWAGAGGSLLLFPSQWWSEHYFATICCSCQTQQVLSEIPFSTGCFMFFLNMLMLFSEQVLCVRFHTCCDSFNFNAFLSQHCSCIGREVYDLFYCR